MTSRGGPKERDGQSQPQNHIAVDLYKLAAPGRQDNLVQDSSEAGSMDPSPPSLSSNLGPKQPPWVRELQDAIANCPQVMRDLIEKHGKNGFHLWPDADRSSFHCASREAAPIINKLEPCDLLFNLREVYPVLLAFRGLIAGCTKDGVTQPFESWSQDLQEAAKNALQVAGHDPAHARSLVEDLVIIDDCKQQGYSALTQIKRHIDYWHQYGRYVEQLKGMWCGDQLAYRYYVNTSINYYNRHVVKSYTDFEWRECWERQRNPSSSD